MCTNGNNIKPTGTPRRDKHTSAVDVLDQGGIGYLIEPSVYGNNLYNRGYRGYILLPRVYTICIYLGNILYVYTLHMCRHVSWCTYLDVVLGKRIAAVSLVDYLSHADHVVVVVENRHAQYQIGRVARHVIDFPVEPRVLCNKREKNKTVKNLNEILTI